MSYKSRAKNRAIRRNQKRKQAAERQITDLLRDHKKQNTPPPPGLKPC